MNSKAKKILISLCCVVLVAAITAVTLWVVNKDDTRRKRRRKEETAAVQSEVQSDTNSDSSDIVSDIGGELDVDEIPNDGTGEDIYGNDWNDNNTDGNLSDGTPFDPEEDPDLEGGDENYDDGWDIEEEIYEYTNPIQMYGNAVKNNKRTVNIKTDEVIHGGFMGFGDHVFTAGLAEEFKEEIGYNEAFYELDMTRANATRSQMARMWFQVDWIVTNTESNPKRTDYENNKDYKNYTNGVYDFDNDILQSAYTYIERYKEIGTEIMFNFGWKHEERIHTWFSQPTANPRQAAPYDAEAFANAAVATIKEFYRRGLDNVTYLTYYNEPDNGGDFETVGDSPTYWAVIARLTDEKLKEEGLRDKVTFIGPEGCNFWRNWHSYLDKFVAQPDMDTAMDYFSVHHYYKTEYGDNNYKILYEDFLYFNNAYKKPIYITEMSATRIECTDKNDAYFYHMDWNDTYASYIIGAANVGAKGVLCWGFGGGYTGNRLGGGWQGQQIYDATRDSVDNIDTLPQEYSECSLMTNYIDRHSDVLMVDWTGDDIRFAVFKSPEGDYTILMDTKGGKDALDITFNFSEKINKKFYKFMYDRNAKPQYNAIIPGCMEEINVTNTFEDTVAAQEAMYIYTTKAPRKQLVLDRVSEKLASGDTTKFTVDFIDCPTDSEIEWTISAATGAEGTISSDGTYVAAANAKKGDFVALRASLKNDKSIYATAVIEIVG